MRNMVHETLTINGLAVPVVSDDNRSSFLCQCGFQFSFDDEADFLCHNNVLCAGCKLVSNIYTAFLGVSATSLWVVSDERTQGSFYHVSSDAGWATNAKRSSVHLGSLVATQYRANDRFLQEDAKEFYIYEMKLKDTAQFMEEVYNDAGDDWSDVDKLVISNRKVAVYLNKFEDPGSLSLISLPEHFDVVGKSESLNSNDIWDGARWVTRMLVPQ